jgi:hypothetical protein
MEDVKVYLRDKTTSWDSMQNFPSDHNVYRAVVNEFYFVM